jgi:FkbM family methyltransferase
MSATDVKRLPVPLRVWAAARSVLPAGLREQTGHRMAARLLRPGRSYRGADGLVLRIDREDQFQRAMLLGLFDPMVGAIVEEFVPEGGQVLDCGSFIGYVALLLAGRVGPQGQVHCFEPDPRVAQRLRYNLAANDASWVEVNEAAVVDRTGRELELALTDQLGWGSVGVDVWHARETIPVRGVAIDDYVEARGLQPAFIKVDVEGAEGDVLRGMTRTLATGRAALLVEWIPWRLEANGHDPAAILELLAGQGYEPHAPSVSEGRLQLTPGTTPERGEDVLFLKR